MTHEPIDTRTWLETPEHVVLGVELAGPASRAAAWLVDLLLRGGLFVAVAIPLGLLGGVGFGALMVVGFLLEWAWFTAWEGAFRGRSPGKAAFGLQVVRADGAPIGWREAFLRNLLRAADELPLTYALGGVVMLADPRFRRIGDLVAGTVVVRARPPLAARAPVQFPPVLPREAAALPPGLRVTRDEAAAIEGWWEAAGRRGAVWADACAERAWEGLRRRLPQFSGGATRALEILGRVAREREPEEHRALAGRQKDWMAIDRKLESLSLRGVWPSDASGLVAAFRSLCADIGRVRQRAPGLADRLDPVARDLHDRIYARPLRRALAPLGAVVPYLVHEVPAEVRRSGPAMLAAAVLFFGSGVLAAVLVSADAPAADAILPPAMREQLGAMYSDRDPRGAESDAQMAGFYVWNNVGIALRAAAAGVLAGVGTAWVLVYNGLVLGGVAAYLTAEGLGGNLLWFIAGHSAWELGAITVAGAAGLRLGATLLVPGPRTRGAALLAAGPALTRLATGAAAMLVVAAAIEGFWSALPLPLGVKVAFGVIQLGLVAAWLGWGARR